MQKKQKFLIKNILKVVISGYLFLLVFQPSFNFTEKTVGFAPVAAQATQTPGVDVQERKQKTQDNYKQWKNIMEFITSLSYIIIWPVIVLAGTAMDNQLVYGSFMNLDTYLWQIWQIIRNFSNFALGLLFLVSILAYNLAPKGHNLAQKLKPQKIITKVLIAGVLINMSWFIVMAMVDLSTVLTYSLGGIPLSIMKDEKFTDETINSLKNQKLLGINIAVNYGNAGSQQKNADDTLVVYRSYAYKDQNNTEQIVYIAPCQSISLGTNDNVSSDFLLGRAFNQYNLKNKADAGNGTDSKVEMIPGYCVHQGILFAFPGLGLENPNNNYYETLVSLKSAMMQDKSNINALQEAINAGLIYPLNVGSDFQQASGVVAGSATVQIDNVSFHVANSNCQTIGYLTGGATNCLYKDTTPLFTVDSLLEKANSYTGPFIALYSSLINYSYLTESGGSVMDSFIEALINAVFAIILVLPLVALLVVLLARVAILWIVIAASPVLVLLMIFEDIIGKSIGKGLGEHLSAKNLINLLVAPVLITFVVGILVVFMTALKNTLGTNLTDPQHNTVNENIGNAFDIGQKDADGFVPFMGFIKIKYEYATISLSWLLMMLFGVALTWFLLFWAIKQTSIGAKIGGSLQKLGESTLGSIPLIPTPAGAVGFNAIGGDQIKRNVDQFTQKIGKRDRDTIDKFFGNTEKDKDTFDYAQLPKEASGKFVEAFMAGDSSVKIGTKDYQVASMFTGPSVSNAVSDIAEKINQTTDTTKKQGITKKLDLQVKELLDITKMDTIATFNTYMHNAYMKHYVLQNYADQYEDKEFTTKDGKKYKIIKEVVSGVQSIKAEEITTP